MIFYQPDAPGDWGKMQATENITVATTKLPTHSGEHIFLRSWVTQGPTVLLIVHGLGAHSGWFIDMGNQLSRSGVTTYAMDLRGFGRSTGVRGHIDNYRILVEDVAFVLNTIHERHPGAHIYILGHSMGGAIAAHVAAKHGDQLQGVLFLNMWIREQLRLSPLTALSIFSGGLLRSRRYWGTGDRTDAMSTNPEAVQMLKADTFWQRERTVTFLVQTLFMRRAISTLANQITIPALFLQSEADASVIAEENLKWFKALVSQDKTWKSYPGYEHDCELQNDRAQLDTDIIEWLYKHSLHFSF
jgi:alpha-beta hydrolase superfamily lysophospholipase